jgi:hypothetical protein
MNDPQRIGNMIRGRLFRAQSLGKRLSQWSICPGLFKPLEASFMQGSLLEKTTHLPSLSLVGSSFLDEAVAFKPSGA